MATKKKTTKPAKKKTARSVKKVKKAAAIVKGYSAQDLMEKLDSIDEKLRLLTDITLTKQISRLESIVSEIGVASGFDSINVGSDPMNQPSMVETQEPGDERELIDPTNDGEDSAFDNVDPFEAGDKNEDNLHCEA